MSLAHRIEQAKHFGIWLHEKTNDRRYPNGIRERTGLSILQLTLDICDAIIVLLQAKVPGPALSLGRPLLEGYVRGFWLLNCASNEQVDGFLSGKCPKFPGLLAAIGKNPETGGAWIHATTATNLLAFHDLTHGGCEHVKRRIRDDSVEPAYPEDELEGLVKIGIEIRIRIGAELLSRLRDEDALGQLNEMAKAFRQEP
jgi:hypothetical protein